MIELPEAVALSTQISESLEGKRIVSVVAGHSPHKFAWFNGDPKSYSKQLTGLTIGGAVNHGGLVEIEAGDMCILFGDGVNLRYVGPGESLPKKHQLLIGFHDESFLAASVQMYGGLWVSPSGKFDNKYYRIACEKPSPLGEAFTREYFDSLFSEELEKLSLKAMLATEQRIPGLGNGVLQDILFNSRCHPKRKVGTLSGDDRTALYEATVKTLKTMAKDGGRDTEKDLFGRPGGYRTLLSKNTVGTPCHICGQTIQKAAYLGGSIYFCASCQAG